GVGDGLAGDVVDVGGQWSGAAGVDGDEAGLVRFGDGDVQGHEIGRASCREGVEVRGEVASLAEDELGVGEVAGVVTGVEHAGGDDAGEAPPGGEPAGDFCSGGGRQTSSLRDWSVDVCSSDLGVGDGLAGDVVDVGGQWSGAAGVDGDEAGLVRFGDGDVQGH